MPLEKKLQRPFYVAGVQFHELHKVIDDMKVGDELNMVEEHDNKYDPYAVALYFNHVQVGYIPKVYSQLVTNALYNHHIVAKVESLASASPPWNRLKIKIEEEDD